jgi:hypothetical protein
MRYEYSGSSLQVNNESVCDLCGFIYSTSIVDWHRDLDGLRACGWYVLVGGFVCCSSCSASNIDGLRELKKRSEEYEKDITSSYFW